MAFGQQSGPPATHRQLQDLLELVIAAGHVDLRDARGPLGLTQRQAAGRFTRDEADALIERLQAEADAPDDESAPGPAPGAAASGEVPAVAPRPKSAPGGAVAAARARREAEALRRLREVPDHLLAAELQRRGWAVMEP
ncbi:MAG: hypothetical protein KDB04_13060 [Acidimicrobiales bacterium]|nr:hypothetical protein [Acidimicrobiales bacterium]